MLPIAGLQHLHEGGLGGLRDGVCAHKLYQYATDRGHADAQCCLANKYYDGDDVEQNCERARLL